MIHTRKTAHSPLFILAGTLIGCAQSYDLDALEAEGVGPQEQVALLELDISEECEESTRRGLAPRELECTGLFADIEDKEISPAMRYFEPAYPLWSDGSGKKRWIYLPPGEQIDASNPNGWEFPVGTRLFKEFSWKGQRVETRMYYKETEDRWLKAAYRWSEDESSATRFVGGEVEVNGDDYYIPSAEECDQCHKGRRDRALGFEGILLGLADPESGITLEQLRDEDLLIEDDDLPDEIEIGDDGTDKAARALGWLHTNCGASCHNDNPAAEAYKTDLYLRLDAERMDGRDVDDLQPLETTIGVEATTERWLGNYRIVPGVPEASLLYWLAARRVEEQADQMPPLATTLLDEERLTWVAQWIRSMPRDPDIPVQPLPFE